MLCNNENAQIGWDDGLEDVMTQYFADIFTATNTDWETIIACMHSKLTRAQNEMLLTPVEEKEVKQAFFHMHPYKSPRPDVMSPGFYQMFWSTTGGDIVLWSNIFLNLENLIII